MKKTNRILALLLISLTVIGAVAFSGAAAQTPFKDIVMTVSSCTTAVNGPKLSWKTISGATKYFVYRKNADNKWEKIATVDSKTTKYQDTAVKSALKTYTYAVKAQNSKKQNTKYKAISLNYVPSPKIAEVKVSTNNVITVTWNRIKNATGYALYRKVEGEQTYTRIATIKGNTTVSYNDTAKKTSNTTYLYTIKAYKTLSKKNYYSSCYSGTKTLFVAAPSIDEVSWTDAGVNVWWNPVKGATKYIVYRADVKNGKRGSWKKLATVSAKTNNEPTQVPGIWDEYNAEYARKKKIGAAILPTKPLEISTKTVRFIDTTGKQFGDYYYTVKAVTKSGVCGSYTTKYHADLEALRWDGLSDAQILYFQKIGNDLLANLGFTIDPTENEYHSSWCTNIWAERAGTHLDDWSLTSPDSRIVSEHHKSFYDFIKYEMNDYIAVFSKDFTTPVNGGTAYIWLGCDDEYNEVNFVNCY